jgi:hypothetical protein
MAFRIHAQAHRDIGQDVGCVFVQQLERTYSNAYQQRGLQQLVDGNQFEPAIALLPNSNLSQGHVQSAPEVFKTGKSARSAPGIQFSRGLKARMGASTLIDDGRFVLIPALGRRFAEARRACVATRTIQGELLTALEDHFIA